LVVGLAVFCVEALLGEVDVFEADLDLEEVFEVADFCGGVVGGLEEANGGEALGGAEEFGVGGGGIGEDFFGEEGGFFVLLVGLAFFVAFVEAGEGAVAGFDVPALGRGKGEDFLDGAVGVFVEEVKEGLLLFG